MTTMDGLNQSAIPDYRSDHELVDMLWNGDENAWEYIFSRAVLPVAKQERFYRIMLDRDLSRRDVLGMVYENLIVRKKLANFRFKCSLVYWIRFYVIKEIFAFCKKIPGRCQFLLPPTS